ncbi:hypothetical protein, partial [Escherichia albertii]
MEVVFIVESGVHGFSPRHTIFRRTDKTRQRRILYFFQYQCKKAILMDGLLFNLMPGSSLLSHGEAPHYHRRYGVSL